MKLNYDKKKTLALVEDMKINYCCSIFGIEKIDVIRWGVDDLFMAATALEETFPEVVHHITDRSK